MKSFVVPLITACFFLAYSYTFAEEKLSGVNWVNLRDAWDDYVNYPSSENARKVSRLLPRGQHVSNIDELTINYIYNDNGDYKILERQIYYGDNDAVELAFRLFTIADGAFAEDLDIYLGELIRVNPKLFLKKLKENRNIITRLDWLVGNEGDVYTDKFRAQELEISLRIKALSSVKDKSLASVRNECIEELKSQLLMIKKAISEVQE